MGKAILTPIICLILLVFLPIEGQDMLFQPLIFGSAIGIANFTMFKINRIIGVLLCIGLSYLIFFLSIYLTFGIGYIYRFIESTLNFEYSDLTTALSILSGGIISALILYFCQSFLFKHQDKKNGILCILIVSLLIPFTVWIFAENKNYTDNSDFDLYQVSWLIFISLGFGIAINQMEIKSRVKSPIPRLEQKRRHQSCFKSWFDFDVRRIWVSSCR
jgi:hypothetical protein